MNIVLIILLIAIILLFIYEAIQLVRAIIKLRKKKKGIDVDTRKTVDDRKDK